MGWVKSARAALTAFLLIILVAGCADGTGQDASQDVATGGARFSTADEETAKLGSEAAPGQFPRTVVHAAGTTEISAKPQRIVVLDTGELDMVMALGVQPVGLATTAGASPVPTYLADQVTDVERIGPLNELNLEAIAALEPDLILGSQLRADKVYPQLSEIAPTVFAIRPGFPWKENFMLVGDALGMENEAVEILNRYADSVAALEADVTDDPTISLVRFLPKGIRLYGDKSFIGVILQDAGLSRPESQQIDELATEISQENIDLADGDVIFYTSYGTPEATGEAAMLEQPNWQSLAGVEAEQAYRVDDDVWYLGIGPVAAELIVTELREKLLTGPAGSG